MNIFRTATFTIMFLMFLFRTSSTAATKDISGLWQGSLKVQSMELRIIFHVEKDSTGMFKATLDSPDQGAKGIIVDKINMAHDSVSFEVTMIGGGFYGVLQPGDSVIAGDWKQGGLSFPLSLRPIHEIAEIRRPQEPKPPFPYTSEEVSFMNTKAGVSLAGTLTKPKSGGPFPVVLLITGSGPQNRDEEIFGHKPFLVLADYLTRMGIAVLRVDDRGVGKSTGTFRGWTTVDFAGDALAGVRYLKTRKDIDKKKIGLIGHSEGGLIAPMVANESKDVAFIVLMAGPSIPGDRLLYLQDSLISSAMGTDAEKLHDELQLNKNLFAAVKEESDTALLHQKIWQLMSQSMAADSANGGKIDTNTIIATAREMTAPWFRFFLTYNPLPALKNLHCPVLALNGSKDLQVPPLEDLEGMRAAFKASGNINVKAEMLPGLNHLFQKADTGSPLEYTKIEETIDPEALKAIGDWVAEVTK
ncbi:MAG TPA: alpha/beta fold hydrolase [Bacteroidota bacterium]|nr:alpha/beta fold hydrolase [Bacteroidota bacterium]